MKHLKLLLVLPALNLMGCQPKDNSAEVKTSAVSDFAAEQKFRVFHNIVEI